MAPDPVGVEMQIEASVCIFDFSLKTSIGGLSCSASGGGSSCELDSSNVFKSKSDVLVDTAVSISIKIW
jgi:hypothetical protein